MLRESHIPTCSSRRLLALDVALVGGALLYVSTEALSFVGRFSRLGATVALLAVVIGGVAWLVQTWPRDRQPVGGLPWLLPIAVIMAATFAAGAAAAPNNWDSMWYHLPRVMHWFENGSVSHYPTDIHYQLYLGPFPEYVVAHLVAITGTDRLAFVGQWLALIGTTAGASVIAQQLGAGRRGQLLTAVLVVTVPMAVVQSSSTQSDLYVSFWCVTAMTSIGRGGNRWRVAITFGTAAALAGLSKATAVLLLLAPAVWLALVLWRRHGREALLPLAAGVCVAALLVAPWMARNVETFGSPLGPDAGTMTADRVSLRDAASGVARNLALQLPPLGGPVVALHGGLGMDAADSATTLGAATFYVPSVQQRHEDTAPSPFHVLAACAAFFGLAARGRQIPYVASLASAVVLFSAVLKWQPYHNRLMLPLVLMSLPLVGLALVTPWVQRTVAVLAVVAALPSAAANPARPLVGESAVWSTGWLEETFRFRPGLAEQYLEVRETLHGCERVELSSTSSAWEYPLWPLLEAGPFGSAVLRYDWSGRPEPCGRVSLTGESVSARRLSGQA